MIDGIFRVFSITYLAIMGAIVIHAVLGFTILFSSIDYPVMEKMANLGPLPAEMEVDMEDDESTLPQDVENPEGEAAEDNSDAKNVSTDANDDREASDTEYGSPLPSASDEDAMRKVLNDAKGMHDDLKGHDFNHQDMPSYKDRDIKDYKGSDLLPGDKAFSGKSMAEFDLNSPRRHSRDGGLKIPGYTGMRGGKIVVLVEVNSTGYVIKAEIDYTRTTVGESFALQKALEYAKRERFNNDPGAPKRQQGTFTYIYVSQ